MKIIFVNNAKVASGAEEHLLDLVKDISSYGIEPVFMVREGGILEGKLKERGYRYYSTFNDKKLSLPMRIAGVIREEKPDVISVNREHNIYPILAGYFLALP